MLKIVGIFAADFENPQEKYCLILIIFDES